jgi:peptidoglycan/LPS O-acetylase OafA/YrhL
MKGKNIQYIPAIDQLRGIAAVLIILYHGLHLITYQLRFGTPFTFDGWLTTESALLAPLIEGHTAVALFMVLSGFIFTHGAHGAQIRYGAFLYNRLLRIFPLFLFLYVAGVYLFPERYSLLGLAQGILLQTNLPGATFIEPFTSLFWTIAVEFQFYLIFPFLLIFQRRYGYRYLLGVILLFTLVRAAGLTLGANARDISYTTILGRMDQFVLGMLVALLFRVYQPPRWLPPVVLALSALALALALVVFHRLGGYPAIAWYKILWPTVEGLLWAGFIYAYLHLFRTAQPALMRGLAWLGELSYSLYLTHLTIFALIIRLNLLVLPPSAPIIWNALATTLLVALPAATLLSLLTYHLIERPFLELRRVYLDRSPHAEIDALSSSK